MTGERTAGLSASTDISDSIQMTGCDAFSGISGVLLRGKKPAKEAHPGSLFETALGLLGYNLQTYGNAAFQPPKCGSGHEALCPIRLRGSRWPDS